MVKHGKPSKRLPQQSQSNKIASWVQIKVIETTQDGQALLEKSLDEMKKYVDDEKKKAMDDAENIRKKANDEAASIKSEAEKEAERIKNKAQDQVEKDIRSKMADEIEASSKEAEKIKADAEAEAKNIKQKANDEMKDQKEKLKNGLEELEKNQKDLIQKGIEYNKKLNEVKKEALESIADDLFNSPEKLEKLEKECASWKIRCETAEGLIKAYDELFGNYDEAVREKTQFEFEKDEYKAELETVKKICKEKIEENEKLRNTIDVYGDDPAVLIQQINKCNEQIAELEDSLAKMTTSEEELQKLREDKARFEQLQQKYDSLMKEKIEIEKEKIELSVDQDELANYKRFVKVLELQKNELQNELSRTIDMYESRAEKVFANLSNIDEKITQNETDGPVSLKELCTNFRLYLANRKVNPLYYSDVAIRTFIAGFSASRLMILQGLSGTGKSSLPRAFADYIKGSTTTLVPVQSSWKDRNDLLGFYNDFKKQYKETDFLNALYTASHDNENIHCIVLDEMNLSRIEYYFADMLSVLEDPDKSKWNISLISDPEGIGKNFKWPELIHDGKLRIRDNTWFIGTANEDDSTFTITDKVYDRSVVLDFRSKGKKEDFSKEDLKKKIEPIHLNNNDFMRSLDAVIFTESEKNRMEEMINKLDYFITNQFEITFGNRILDQMYKFVPRYIACGGTVDEAVDVIFSSKILRKLEGIYDEGMKTSLGQLRDGIDKLEYKMPLSKNKITKMEKKL